MEQAGAYKVGALEFGLPDGACLVGVKIEADVPPVHRLEAYATAAGPEAYATAAGPEACATAAGPEACATAAGPEAYATAAGPEACAELAGPDRVGLQKRYLFSTYEDRHLAPLLQMPKTLIRVERASAGRFVVRCPDDAAAPLVALRADGLNDHSGPYLTWGYAPFLMPGDEVEVEVSSPGDVEVTALNAGTERLRFE